MRCSSLLLYDDEINRRDERGAMVIKVDAGVSQVSIEINTENKIKLI